MSIAGTKVLVRFLAKQEKHAGKNSRTAYRLTLRITLVIFRPEPVSTSNSLLCSNIQFTHGSLERCFSSCAHFWDHAAVHARRGARAGAVSPCREAAGGALTALPFSALPLADRRRRGWFRRRFQCRFRLCLWRRIGNRRHLVRILCVGSRRVSGAGITSSSCFDRVTASEARPVGEKRAVLVYGVRSSLVVRQQVGRAWSYFGPY